MTEEHKAIPEPGKPGGRLRGPDPHVALVLRIEWTLLTVRYLTLFVLVGHYALGIRAAYSPDLRIIAAAAILHNAFAHWVFYTERYDFFLTPLNFLIYLASVSLAVGLTGAEESPVALLYLLFIILYCTYVPRFLNTFRLTLICCVAYSFTVLTRWVFTGVNLAYPPIGVHLVMILLCGWTMKALGGLLRNMKLETQSQGLALASSEATLRAILDSTAYPILVYDENEFIADVNDQACAFLGCERHNLLGRRFRSFLFDDGTLPNKMATLRARGDYRGEALVTADGGEERQVDLHVRSFIRDNRRVFVAMLHDITEQRNLREASRMATLKLEQINRELQQVNTLRTAFFAAISQRLRSPLSAILGYMDLLLNEELGEIPPEQRKALQSCRRSALRVFALVDEATEVASHPPHGDAGDTTTSGDSPRS